MCNHIFYHLTKSLPDYCTVCVIITFLQIIKFGENKMNSPK